MDDFKLVLVGALGFINAFLVGYFGVFTPLLYLTIALMILDLGTRCYAAGRRKDEKVQSKLIMMGIYKKLGMCILIVLALILDFGLIQISNNLGITIASKVIFAALTLAWIFVREFISNLENLNHAGVELPKFLLKALNVAKDKVDQMGDAIVGEGDKKNEDIQNRT